MKNFCIGLLAFICFFLFGSGCRYYYPNIEVGSEWNSDSLNMHLEFIYDAAAQGTIIWYGEKKDIECNFGPGKRDFSVRERFLQKTFLFGGDYFVKGDQMILFVNSYDYPQLEWADKKIVLYKNQ